MPEQNQELSLAHNLGAVGAACGPFFGFLAGSRWGRCMGDPDICDFVVGNPHEPPMPEYVEAIRAASVPRAPGWFGYTLNDPIARSAVAAALNGRFGLRYAEEDVFLARGASGALMLALNTLLDPDDEVIYLRPPWFFYRSMIAFAGGVPVAVPVRAHDFDIDVEAVAAAITARTKAIVVNSPNNPTGRIYPETTLRALAEVLRTAQRAHGRPIWLLSDECYSRLVFDGAQFVPPSAFHPFSMLLYSYAKNLLTPGQRLGYLALSPRVPDREAVRRALLLAQYNNGYALPDAVLQHALPALEPLCIDIGRLQRRRDRLVEALRGQGYRLGAPEGAWYVLVASPIADDEQFADLLADDDVYVLPGRIIEMPGHFRICLTASDDMVERAIPRFAAAMTRVRRHGSASPEISASNLVVAAGAPGAAA